MFSNSKYKPLESARQAFLTFSIHKKNPTKFMGQKINLDISNKILSITLTYLKKKTLQSLFYKTHIFKSISREGAFSNVKVEEGAISP